MEPILEHDLVHPCCEDDGLCIVCLESERNTRLPCGHELMCGPCAVKLMKVKAICPTCRTRYFIFHLYYLFIDLFFFF